MKITRFLVRLGLVCLFLFTMQNSLPLARAVTFNAGEGSSAAIWRPMNGTGLPPLNQLHIKVILADPVDPQTVYLGTSPDYGLYGGVYGHPGHAGNRVS